MSPLKVVVSLCMAEEEHAFLTLMTLSCAQSAELS